MSTRCQVQVIAGPDRITLYHHTDGYPEYMIPLIARAYRRAVRPIPSVIPGYPPYDNSWVAGRVEKAASFLCWADPDVMEPEVGHALHGDIDFLYRVYIRVVDGKPQWNVLVYTPRDGFWDAPADRADQFLHPFCGPLEVLTYAKAIRRAAKAAQPA